MVKMYARLKNFFVVGPHLWARYCVVAVAFAAFILGWLSGSTVRGMFPEPPPGWKFQDNHQTWLSPCDSEGPSRITVDVDSGKWVAQHADTCN